MPVERRGQVTDVGIGSTGNGRSPMSRRKAAAFVRWHEPDDVERCHVRICERLGVKFPGPTRRWRSGLMGFVLMGQLLSE